MTVTELIEQLKEMDGERQVILQRDSEGNGHSPLSECWTGTYVPETTWSGEAHLEVLTDGDRAVGFTEDDVRTDGEPAVFLSPMN